MNESSIDEFYCKQISHTFATTNSFRKQFFAGNQSDLRERKVRIDKLFIGSVCLKIVFLKILPSRQNKMYL